MLSQKITMEKINRNIYASISMQEHTTQRRIWNQLENKQTNSIVYTYRTFWGVIHWLMLLYPKQSIEGRATQVSLQHTNIDFPQE